MSDEQVEAAALAALKHLIAGLELNTPADDLPKSFGDGYEYVRRCICNVAPEAFGDFRVRDRIVSAFYKIPMLEVLGLLNLGQVVYILDRLQQAIPTFKAK